MRMVFNLARVVVSAGPARRHGRIKTTSAPAHACHRANWRASSPQSQTIATVTMAMEATHCRVSIQ